MSASANTATPRITYDEDRYMGSSSSHTARAADYTLGVS